MPILCLKLARKHKRTFWISGKVVWLIRFINSNNATVFTAKAINFFFK